MKLLGMLLLLLNLQPIAIMKDFLSVTFILLLKQYKISCHPNYQNTLPPCHLQYVNNAMCRMYVCNIYASSLRQG